MDPTNLRDLKPLLARHGFRFSRALGQNFLIDPAVPERIAEAAGLDEKTGVLEVGPGVGSLTRALARRAGKVAAVELDRKLLPLLSETLSGVPNVEVVPGDVLRLDLAAFTKEHLPGLRPVVCANLPYSVTTPALTALLEAGVFCSMTVMVQREVALRLCAAAGTPEYGAFSVYTRYHAAPEILFDVPPESFLPAPKVTSSVVRLTPHAPPPCVADEDFFFRVVRAAFAQRRKTLQNALSSAFGDRERVRAAIAACALPADVRGERLDMEAFAALARRLQQ
ncbi:MAG TPA: 16S rRNA (adenine(1518)-N(6)/adenine(1519)-N(6))-dimethyltransferase RsmA [Oscillospiraceae bacterium]|nr:16S rRNA (adenine(1518)-N(6)/adenine(1519)-N(6))-dimethyltransferase RsmA [Oscillospiraceae bacterium]